MRHGNWTIDQEHLSLTVHSKIDTILYKDYTSIPFKTDNQYNIFLDITVGNATVKNVLVDYGSNGGISLSSELFNTLKTRKIIDNTMTDKGMQQSGIVGIAVESNREIAYSDSFSIAGIGLNKVRIKSGKSLSIGNSVLSQFKVTIDLTNKKLYLLNNGDSTDSVRLSGFRLGYSEQQGIYVQSVIEQSNAYSKGVRTMMKVVKLDGLDFEKNNDFCDYINHKFSNTISLVLIDFSGQKVEYVFDRMNI